MDLIAVKEALDDAEDHINSQLPMDNPAHYALEQLTKAVRGLYDIMARPVELNPVRAVGQEIQG